MLVGPFLPVSLLVYRRFALGMSGTSKFALALQYMVFSYLLFDSTTINSNTVFKFNLRPAVQAITLRLTVFKYRLQVYTIEAAHQPSPQSLHFPATSQYLAIIVSRSEQIPPPNASGLY